MRKSSRTRGGGTSSKDPASQIVVIRRSDFSALPKLVLDLDGDHEEVDDYPAIARGYAEAMVERRIPGNRLIIAACQRYLRMLEMAEDEACEFYFSPKHVVDYCSFIEKLRHWESGLWEINQEGDARVILEPFQIWIESAIHGFRRRVTGERLVTTALELLPRKSAKTFKMVGGALFELCCSGQLAPQIPIAASSERQADDTLYGAILKAIGAEPELEEHYKLHVTQKQITCGDGKIWKLTSQGEKQDGLNPSLAIFEEGHAGAISVYNVIDSAFGARPNQLRRMITTAGYRAEGPAYDLLLDAKRILLGKAEDYTFFAAVYQLDEEDYLDPETQAIDWNRLIGDEYLVAKANPMYGISLDPAKLREAAITAKRRPDKRPEYARTRFNIWTGAGLALVDPVQWTACKADVSLSDFIGHRCWLAVDLASFNDMCAIVLLFEKDGALYVFCKYFIPSSSPLIADPDLHDLIMRWREAEHIEVTEGSIADYERIEREIALYCEVFDVQGVAFDPYQSNHISKRIFDRGVPVFSYSNNAALMTTPTDDLLGRITNQTVRHDGNEVLAWNAGNVHGEKRENGSIMPRKEKEGSKRKVDGFVAMVMANGLRMGMNAKQEGEKDKRPVDPFLARGERLLGIEEAHV